MRTTSRVGDIAWSARRLIGVCLLLGLTACAGYGGRGLQPGIASVDEVVAVMGTPSMRWKDPDGGEQLAYPRGPMGTQTFMAFIAPGGLLARIEPVLNEAHFARVVPGQSDLPGVLRLLGPVPQQNIEYFKRRDERVWSWLYCDAWSQQAYFDVLFDGTTGVVRSVYRRPRYVGFRDADTVGCGR